MIPTVVSVLDSAMQNMPNGYESFASYYRKVVTRYAQARIVTIYVKIKITSCLRNS